MERNKRVDWVDAAKGTGILLIIGAHSIRPDMREAQMVCKFIYDLIDSVAIGMFIVLAGVTYRMSGSWSTARPGRFLYKKVRTLLFPFLGYALLIYVLFSFAAWYPVTAKIFRGTEYAGMAFREYLWLTLFADSPYAAHLWFIWVLFWVTIVVYICDLLCRCWKLPNQKVLWLVAGVFYVIGSLGWRGNSIVQRVLTHMIYFVYGTEFSIHSEMLKHDSICSKAAVALSAVAMMGHDSIGWHAVSWYGGVLWQVCWLAVQLILIWGTMRLAVRLKGMKWLAYFGRESFWIYLLHQPFCCGFVGLLLYSRLGLSIPLVCTVCILLGLLLPLCAVRLGRWALRR